MPSLLLKIWTFITSKAGEWLAIGGVIATTLALVRKSGADSVRSSEMKQTIKDLGIKNEIHEEVSKLSDNDLDKQLQQWKE